MNQFEMKQKAYQSNLKSRALQVLLYLIDRSNKEKTCFPAISTISRELHISISTVKRAMRELVEAGYVQKESRFREGNRGQTSNIYTLFFPKLEISADCGNAVKTEEGMEHVEQDHMVYAEMKVIEKTVAETRMESITSEKIPVNMSEEEIDDKASGRVVAGNIIRNIVQTSKLRMRINRNRSRQKLYTRKYQSFYRVLLVYYFKEIRSLDSVWLGEGFNLIPP